MNPLSLINKSFGTYNIKGFYIEPTYWQAGAIIILLFLLVFSLARLRHMYVHWSVSKPSLSFIFYGFLLAWILEGFLIIGGRTFITEVVGWKNAPKPISTVLEAGRAKLVDVLGVTKEVPESVASGKMTPSDVIEDFENLPGEDKIKVQEFVCKP